MKCNNCGTENSCDAKFCRRCGSELAKKNDMRTNVMDRYPKYHFVPTNLLDWKRPWFARLRTTLFSIILVCCFLFFCYSVAALFLYNSRVEKWHSNNQNHEYFQCDIKDKIGGVYMKYTIYNETELRASKRTLWYYQRDIISGIIITCLISFISIIVIIYGSRKYPQKSNRLSNYADYVQKYRYSGFIRGRKNPILKFYVKDNRMGLLDVAHYSVFLSAQYDRLEWREENKYLNATSGNRTYIIDIYGKELK